MLHRYTISSCSANFANEVADWAGLRPARVRVETDHHKVCCSPQFQVTVASSGLRLHAGPASEEILQYHLLKAGDSGSSMYICCLTTEPVLDSAYVMRQAEQPSCSNTAGTASTRTPPMATCQVLPAESDGEWKATNNHKISETTVMQALQA